MLPSVVYYRYQNARKERRNMTVDTKELVTTIAYMIGVKDEIMTKCFEPDFQGYNELIEKLQNE